MQVHWTWIEGNLRKLQELLARDPQGARRELQKHIEDLRVTSVSMVGNRVVKISGRTKPDDLLGEEAVRLQLVAGVGFEPTTFGL